MLLLATNVIHIGLLGGLGYLLKKTILRSFRLGTLLAGINFLGSAICVSLFPLYYGQITNPLNIYSDFYYQPLLFFPGSWAYLIGSVFGFHLWISGNGELQSFVYYALGPTVGALIVETPVLIWLGRFTEPMKVEPLDHCPVCEHDFRGLGAIAVCPECGAPTEAEVPEDREFDRADSGWNHEE